MERKRILKVSKLFFAIAASVVAVIATAVPAFADTIPVSDSNVYKRTAGAYDLTLYNNSYTTAMKLPTCFPNTVGSTLTSISGVTVSYTFDNSYLIYYIDLADSSDLVFYNLNIRLFYCGTASTYYQKDRIYNVDRNFNHVVDSNAHFNRHNATYYSYDDVKGVSGQGRNLKTAEYPVVSWRSGSSYNQFEIHDITGSRYTKTNDDVVESTSTFCTYYLDTTFTFSLTPNRYRYCIYFRLDDGSNSNSYNVLLNNQFTPTGFGYSSYPLNVVDISGNFGSWADFLNKSVGAFFSFELFPGFTIGGIFSILIAVLVVVIFLRLYAGG